MQPTEMDAQYATFRQQVQPLPSNQPHSHQLQSKHDMDAEEDLDMDAQLENVSPERGGSSLQVSLDRHSNPSQRLPPILPSRNPRLSDASESQTTKRRKADDYTATSTPTILSKLLPPSPSTRSKRVGTLGIDMVSRMWLGFHMHEEFSIQCGKQKIMEKRTNEEFHVIGTPDMEVQEFRSLRHAFPHTKQVLYPSERPDAVSGQHLHFTQVPKYERTSNDTGLTDGFHITIRFDGDYKALNRREVKSACLDRLRLMHIPLGTTYSNPIDIGINTDYP